MSVPLLLDENLEHEVYHRLRSYGYDVVHVDYHDELAKGDSDHRLVRFSREHDRLIVTYDDDFESQYDADDYWGVLFFTDNDWSATAVADTVHRILDLYPPADLRGMNVVGREWL